MNGGVHHIERVVETPRAARPTRRSLILTGGALRAPYHAGVMRALDEAGITFAHINATSGGAINLAMRLSGLTPAEMCARWSALEPHHLAALMPLPQYPPKEPVMATGDADAIVHDVFPRLGIDIARIRSAADIVGSVNVGNFTSKTVESIPHTALDIDWIVASLSLPILLPPVKKGDSLYVDPVCINGANLQASVRAGCDELWLVWYVTNSAKYGAGLLQQYGHMLQLSANGALFVEFERIRELNRALHAGAEAHGGAPPVRLHLVRPDHPLPFEPDYYVGRMDASTLVALGYRDAHAYLALRSDEGVAFEPSVTAMADPVPGVTFREVLSGPFAMGATDPLDGETRGDQDATTLTLHAAIFIRDIYAFASGRDQHAELVGSVSFPGLGKLQIRSGRFFHRPAGHRSKTLVYEVVFQARGVTYCLAGRKDVTDDPEFDAWTALTTVTATLHEGPEPSGAVVGAGVLRLSPADLLKLVSSLSTPGTDGPREAADTINLFGRLFLGELWSRYAPHALGS